MTAAERAERAKSEVTVPAPKQIRPPTYLPENLKEAFRTLARKLRDARLYTELDADNLARYLLSRQSYLAATQDVLNAQKGSMVGGRRVVDMEALDAASRIQERFFKQARNCANDMGLTVTSRCRIALPPALSAPVETALERLMREREERRAHA